MGAWGAGLYQDDVTCDVKDDYLNRLRIGYTNEEATEDVIDCNYNYIEDVEDGPIFWMALADTQWKYGRLLPSIKEKALEVIHSGSDLERWKEEPTNYRKRKKVLEELEKRLTSSQPPEKKITKLRLHKSTWDIGDVLLLKLHDDKFDDKPNKFGSKWYNKYVLLKVVGVTRTSIGGLPETYYDEQNVVRFYNWVGAEEPNIKILDKLKLIEDKTQKIQRSMSILSFNRNDIKKLGFKVIYKEKEPKNKSDYLMDIIGIYWEGLNTIEYSIIEMLKVAEKDGYLIEE